MTHTKHCQTETSAESTTTECHTIRRSATPTEAQAIRLDELSRKIALVEQTAIEAGEDIAEWILKGVTLEDATFYYLKTFMNIPCEKDMYYDRRLSAELQK